MNVLECYLDRDFFFFFLGGGGDSLPMLKVTIAHHVIKYCSFCALSLG